MGLGTLRGTGEWSPCPSELWPQKQPPVLEVAIAWRDCDGKDPPASPSCFVSNNRQLSVFIKPVLLGLD